MAYRFREQYQAVLGKGFQLRQAGAFSVPDQAGSRVAILVPFMDELVYDPDDSRANFVKQTDELMAHYTRNEHDPYAVMGATQDDFKQALTDRSVSSVVVAGFGNFSAVAVPFSKDRQEDPRFGYLDWLHLAGMANHLKLGKFVMYTCCGYMRKFNPPLPVGVVKSHANIHAPAGLGFNAKGMRYNERKVRQVTTEDQLTYDAIKEQFKKPTPEDTPPIQHGPAYIAVRGLYRALAPRIVLERGQEYKAPPSTPIPHPDLREYLS